MPTNNVALTFKGIPDGFDSYFIRRLAEIIGRPRSIHSVRNLAGSRAPLAVASYNIPPAWIGNLERLCGCIEQNNSLGITITIAYGPGRVAKTDSRERAWLDCRSIRKRLAALEVEYRSVHSIGKRANDLISSFLAGESIIDPNSHEYTDK